MKLISLREFVLNQKGLSIQEYYHILKYAKFLSRPLELGMFVPCDLDGNVLDQPLSEHEQQLINDGWEPEFGFSELEDYNEAKSRVLFEGFEISMPNKATHRITNGVLQIDFFEDDHINSRDGIHDNWAIIEIIEDMLKYSVTLTETARKEIEL